MRLLTYRRANGIAMHQYGACGGRDNMAVWQCSNMGSGHNASVTVTRTRDAEVEGGRDTGRLCEPRYTTGPHYLPQCQADISLMSWSISSLKLANTCQLIGSILSIARAVNSITGENVCSSSLLSGSVTWPF